MDAKTVYLTATAAQVVLPFLLCLLLRPLEVALPLRQAALPLPLRWWANMPLAMASNALAILGSYTLAGRIGSYGASLNLFSLAAAPLPGPLKFVVGLLIIDARAYGLHVLSHKSGLLWRLHQIHHSDNEFDASTGLRHQPLEGLVSLYVLTFFFGLLGMPFLVIAAYGTLSAMHGVLSHANVAIPPRLDGVLRWLIVTPDMHRLHHSAEPNEYDSNYGQLFPFWDWLFRTLRRKSRVELAKMPLGLANAPDAGKMSAIQLTLLAFAPNQERSGNSRNSRKSQWSSVARSSVVMRQTGRPKKAKRTR